MLTEILFYALGILTVASAILALEAKDDVYAILSLGAMMLDIAGIFILMESIFIALIQLLVYAGTVVILMMIAIMLLRTTKIAGESIEKVHIDIPYEATAIVLGFLSIVFVVASIYTTKLSLSFEEINMGILAKTLFVDYPAIFILIIFLVGAILVGAFTVLTMERQR